MKTLFILSTLAVLTFGCRTADKKSQVKLVDGTVVEVGIGLDGIVMLKLNGSPCTGMHIGNGYILTAAHCLIIAGGGNKPTIAILNENRDHLMTLRPNEYDEVRPQTAETISMSSGGVEYEIPDPDLSIIRPKSSSDVAVLSNLSIFLIGENALDVDEQGILVAGYGLHDYDAFDVDGKLRLGKAAISDSLDKVYATFWRRDNNIAGGSGSAPGDSGGPLFSLGGDQVVLHGVASNIIRNRDEEQQTIKVWTQYTRLDNDKIRKWIMVTAELEETSAPDGGAIDQEIPTVDDSQFVGIYKCKTAENSSPYFVVSLNFNDPQFLKVEQARTVTATTEEVPSMTRFSEDNIINYGTMMVIPHSDGGRFSFYYEENPVKLEKYDRMGDLQYRFTCSKQ